MEIANLEHELAVLRERYSTMLSEAAKVRRVFTYGGSIALAALIAAVIYLGSRSSDALPILFLVTGLVVVIGLIAWHCKPWIPDDPKSRFHFNDERYPFLTNEEFLNHAIAIREERLRELRAAS